MGAPEYTPMKTNGRRRLRLGALTVGLLLLVNPSVNLFDLLPDFIGYALILYATAPAAEAAPYFADARERFLKLFWVGASKYPALLLMMAIYAGDLTQRSIIAVFALVYATVELLLLIPAFRFLCEGFFYLGDRHDCDVAIAREGKLIPEHLPRLAYIFFTARAIGSFLPELALVPYGEEGETQRFAAQMLRAYPFLVLLSLLVVLCLAIFYFRRMHAYLRRLQRDGRAEEIIGRLLSERRLALARKQDYRAIKTATVWLIVAAGLSIDLVLDHINFVPDVLSGAALVVAFIILGSRIPHIRIGVAVAGAYSVAALVSYVLLTGFYSRYTISDLYGRGDAALSAYGAYLSAALAELILSAALGVFLVYLLIKMIPYVADSFGEQESIQTMHLRRSMKREAILVGVIHLLAAGASYANALLSQYTKNITLESGAGSTVLPPTTSATVPLVDGFWLVPLLAAVAELIAVLHLTSRFRTESDLTYSDIVQI